MRCGWSANESLGAPFEGADRRDTAQIWVKNFVFLALKWQIFFGGALPPKLRTHKVYLQSDCEFDDDLICAGQIKCLRYHWVSNTS